MKTVCKKNFWSQPLRIESNDDVVLVTSRCMNSRLWFVNNSLLEERIYSFLGKYQKKYNVTLYAFVLMGNHYHLIAKFNESNAALFFRDFNARIAESVRILVKDFEGGTLFSQRYSLQVLPTAQDIENYFLYCALQPITSKLTSRVSDYPAYNFFNDAIKGINKKYKHFRFGEYNSAKRRNRNLSKKNFWEENEVVFSRLPTYEKLEKEEYIKIFLEKIEKRRKMELEKQAGNIFFEAKQLRKIKPGSLPKESKKVTRRPLVLTICQKAKESYLSFYFKVVSSYKEISKKFREGEFDIDFPIGTYRPPGHAIS